MFSADVVGKFGSAIVADAIDGDVLDFNSLGFLVILRYDKIPLRGGLTGVVGGGGGGCVVVVVSSGTLVIFSFSTPVTSEMMGVVTEAEGVDRGAVAVVENIDKLAVRKAKVKNTKEFLI